MEILETIPMYEEPIWAILMIIFGIGICGASFLCGITEGFDVPKWIIIVMIIIPLCIGIAGIFCCANCKIHTHDEYVVRLNDISVQEFAEEYTVVDRYPYSDVIRVKKAVTEEK